jgi:predicted phage terminase large subunit-like protein
MIQSPVSAIAQYMLDYYDPAPAPEPRWKSPGALAKTLDPGTIETPALQAIDRALVEFETGDCNRLMIWMPPQEGKSVRVSQRYVEWALERNPNLRFGIVSYADEMARRWGSDIKLDLETFNGFDDAIDIGIQLRADSRAAGRWQIQGKSGGVYCVGVAGALTGKAVDRLVIDDPIKDLEQAQSSRYRERAKKFWQAVAVPRLGPMAKCVIIQTRWHEDDLSGWLLRNEPDRWKIVRIPAIAEYPHAVYGPDPLGREPGTPMISARGSRDWAQIRKDVGEYVWASLYQQRPAPAAGGLFKRASLRYWHKDLPDPNRHDRLGGMRGSLAGRIIYLDECWRFLTVDLAATEKTSADWTAVGVWAISLTGDLILLDGTRARIEETGHWDLVRPLRERWSADVVYVESRMFGTTLVYEAGQNHVPVLELKAETDKITRSLPATARADSGRLWLPGADTSTLVVNDLIDELTQFPNAVHDDYVDVVSYAARVAAAHWISPEKNKTPRNNGQLNGAIGKAYESATGTTNGHETDYMSLEF